MKNNLFLCALFMLSMGKTGYAMKRNSHDLPPVIDTMGKHIDSSGMLYTDPPGTKTSAPVPVASSPFFPLLVVDYFIKNIQEITPGKWLQSFKHQEKKLFALTQKELNAIISFFPREEYIQEYVQWRMNHILPRISMFYAKNLFLKNKVLPELIKHCVYFEKLKEKHLKKPSSLIKEEAPEAVEMEIKAQKIKQKHLIADLKDLREDMVQKMSKETLTAYEKLDYTSIVSEWAAQRPPSFVEKYEDMENTTDSMFFYPEIYTEVITKYEKNSSRSREKCSTTNLEEILQDYLDRINQSPCTIEMEEEQLNPHRVKTEQLGFRDSTIRVFIIYREGKPHGITLQRFPYEVVSPNGPRIRQIDVELTKEKHPPIPQSELVSSSDFFPLFMIDHLIKALQQIDLTTLYPPVKNVEELKGLFPHVENEEEFILEILSSYPEPLIEDAKKQLLFLFPEEEQEIERLMTDIIRLHWKKVSLKSKFPFIIGDYYLTYPDGEIKPEYLENSALFLKEKTPEKLHLKLAAVKVMEKHRMRELLAIKKDIVKKLSNKAVQTYLDLGYETILSQWKEQTSPRFTVARIRKVYDNGRVLHATIE